MNSLFLKEDIPKEDWKKWLFRIEKSMADYLKVKPREEMINPQDFSLIVTYCSASGERNESMEFIIAHLADFKNIIPENVLVSHVNKYFSARVNFLAMKGDVQYKEEIGRMDGDMKLLFSSLPVVEVEALRKKFSLRADGLYLLCGKNDQVGYIRFLQEYFKGVTDSVCVDEYEFAVQALMTFTKGKLTREAAQQSLLWLDKLVKLVSEVDKQVVFVASMGDCFLVLENKAKAKECYNQAYLLSFQTQDVKMQTYLRKKMTGLEG